MSDHPEPSRIDWDALAAHPDVQALMELSIQEDIGGGDLTTQSLFPEARTCGARIVSRAETTACGVPLAWKLFQRFDPGVRLRSWAREGQRVGAGEALCELEGDARAILTAERAVLNFLMRLSGVAHQARRAAALIPDGVEARVYDTRKTLPGWRLLDKAAVKTGGAENHRVGLFDAVLIKDNHLALWGSIADAVRTAREGCPEGTFIQVEVDTLDQLDEVLAAEPDSVLLDNFGDDELRAAVARASDATVLEASGGITLDNLAAVAATGVQRISLGMLTHTVVPADFTLEML